MSFTYSYPRPSVTVDIILIHHSLNIEKVLLIKRKNEPFKDCWAFPGGFVDENEDLINAAIRELHEETGIKTDNLIQLSTVGTPGRDPRGHTISVVYGAIVNQEFNAVANDDAKEVKWFDIENLPKLAFDHKKILNDSIKTLYLQKEKK